MNKNTRFEFRTGRNGWATVTVKAGYSSSTETLEVFKIRKGGDALAVISEMAKAKGAQGISWGACSSKYQVGFSF